MIILAIMGIPNYRYYRDHDHSHKDSSDKAHHNEEDVDLESDYTRHYKKYRNRNFKNLYSNCNHKKGPHELVKAHFSKGHKPEQHKIEFEDYYHGDYFDNLNQFPYSFDGYYGNINAFSGTNHDFDYL